MVFCAASMCFVVAANALPALAQQARLDRLVVAGVGVLESETKKITSPDILSGQKYETSNVRLVKAGSDIALRLDMQFGVLLSVVGAPKGAVVPVKIRWTYPGDGMTRPDNNANKKFDEYDSTVRIGAADQSFGWLVKSEYQRVAGVWTLEIWTIDKARRLVVQTFNVTN